MNFSIGFSIFVNYAIRILIGIALKVWITLDSVGILTKLNLLIHEYNIFSPFVCVFNFFLSLFVSSLIL
jgi:hypothetical protein